MFLDFKFKNILQAIVRSSSNGCYSNEFYCLNYNFFISKKGLLVLGCIYIHILLKIIFHCLNRYCFGFKLLGIVSLNTHMP